jgi:hypothetical protein
MCRLYVYTTPAVGLYPSHTVNILYSILHSSPACCRLLADGNQPLAAAGVQHGALLFLLYHVQREVEPVVKKKDYEKRPFGSNITVRGLGQHW